MLVLDEEKLNIILAQMAEGFNRSPLEIVLFFTLILGILLTVILFHRRQLLRFREQRIRISRHHFLKTVRERNLGPGDISLLESMAGFLNAPGLKHRLVESQGVFNSCAGKLLESGGATSSEIAALRLRLGFRRRNPEQPFRSTAQLYEDLPVIVVQKNGKGCRGRIDRVEPYLLGIEIGGGDVPLVRGVSARVYFQTPSGRFMFTSQIRRIRKNSIEIMHSEHIKRLQRRQFYRKRLMLPVYVKAASVDEPARLTILIDLGGGGASIAKGEMHLEVGERISLWVHSAEKEKIDVTATVLRLSRGNKIAHIKFDNILESDRDRIMNLLFRPKKK